LIILYPFALSLSKRLVFRGAHLCR